jgi:predicted GIY-YIG superfamily endonuclease
MASVYILECSDGTYYVGSTTDLGARLEQHRLGMGARYTARRRPVKLVWSMEFESVVDAFAFEKQVQNWSRQKRRALIDGRLDDLPGLARGRSGYMSRQLPSDSPGLD